MRESPWSARSWSHVRRTACSASPTYSGGWSPLTGRAMVSGGFGVRANISGWQLDTDAVALVGGLPGEPVLAPRLRTALGRPLRGEHLAPYAALGLALEIPLEGETELSPLPGAAIGDSARMVPSLAVGLRY